MKNELKKLARQQPNKKFLNIWRFRLAAYNVATRKDSIYYDVNPYFADTTGGKLKQWLKNKIGEPPVVFDSTLMKSSEVRMNQHLFNNGYFNSEVTSDFISKRKKTKVTYNVAPNERYYINNISMLAEDSAIHQIIKSKEDQTYLNKGDPYQAKVLEAERTRLANNIQDEGYFTFNREYVKVEIDTVTPGNLKADVFYTVKNPVDTTERHDKYLIGEIQVELLVQRARLKFVDLTQIDTANLRNILTLLPKKTVKPKPIVRAIFFDEDSLYRKSDYNLTLQRLNSLGVFRLVNIAFEPYKTGLHTGILNTKISAVMRKKQAFNIENEWNTDSKQSLGMELSTAYINRNIFKGADRFEFNLSGGIELQIKKINNGIVRQSVVNTVQLRPDFKFKFPSLIVPFKINSGYEKRNNLPILYDQNSSINLAYEYERRLGFYTIHNANISWQHDWYATPRIRHIIEMPSLSLVAPVKNSFSASFLQTLENFPSLRRSFDPQFIATLLNYSFIYNGQFKRDKHFVFYKANAKSTGNLLHGIMSLTNKGNEKPYQLLGIDYSQFVRFESDLRYFINLKNGNRLATRFFTGVGVPYGNVNVLPFVEQFFGGGNQSMRAWNYRGIGPGGFDNRNLEGLPDQAGDIKIEFNTEFRFTIYKFLKAAFFLDAGNVWALRKDVDRPDAEFRFSRSDGKKNSFIDEIAMDIGFGVRLDFNFFVVRLDAALPIRDPAFDDDDRWQFDKIDLSKGSDYRDRMGLIIAIGYPF
jgi:outer membrane protein insertion porin family